MIHPTKPEPASDEQRAGYLAQASYVLAEAGIHDRPARERRAIILAREQRRQRRRERDEQAGARS